jgi:Microcystin-dependent protein
MPRNSVEEWSTTADDNTDVGGVNIANGCAPSGINDAIRTIMAQVKSFRDTLISSLTPRLVPSGVILDFGGSDAPTGYLLCYGQAVSRSTYAALFAAIGTTYGVGDGSTTFNVPDLRGRVAAGKDNMGGTPANRLTSPLNGDNLGAAGGSESHTLTTAQMPSHNHSFSGTTSSDSHDHNLLMSWARNASGGTFSRAGYAENNSDFFGSSRTPIESDTHSHTFSGTTGNQGSGNAHPNVQPTIILNKIIKT